MLKRLVLRGMRWAASAATLLALAPGAASAIDFDLPGERKLEVHGFYEIRLVGLGEDLPWNGVTFSQFRHILNLETEVGLFPDGIGPFDLVSMFARTAVRYDCIYSHSCGLFPSSNAWGSVDRTPKRLPYSIPIARNAQYIGGSAARMRLVPGTLRNAQGPLNPNRAPRTLLNPAGEVVNINELALLANLNYWQSSRLDLPVDRFLVLDNQNASARQVRTRAGAFPPGFRESHLLLLRDDLGVDRASQLSGLIDQGRFLSSTQPLLRALNSQIGTLGRQGDPQGMLPGLLQQRDALLFSDPSAPGLDTVNLDYFAYEPGVQRALLYPEFAGSGDLNMISARGDQSIFARLARASTPELLEATFGGMERSNGGVAAYIATMDLPPKPFGVFDTGGRPVDVISNTASGVALQIGQLDIAALPSGLIGASPATDSILQSFPLSSRPGYVGGDGRYNTADDLPETGTALPAGLRPAERGSPDFPLSTWSQDLRFESVALIEGTVDDRAGVSTEGSPLVLFGVLSAQAQLEAGCRGLGGTLQDGTCVAGGEPIPPEQVSDVGCQSLAGSDGGRNRQGDCLVLNVRRGSPTPTAGRFRGIHPDVLLHLADPRFRPQRATAEPTDLTEYKNFAGFGSTLPARPRSEGHQLFFESKGLHDVKRRSHHLVSDLDIDFTMDELAWGHGASDDEHELREGFVEAELFDSQFFARVGKMLMVWGKTELFRNQDRLNPIDLSEGVVTRLEEARVGQWALDMVYSPVWAMQMGRFEDLRLELAVIFDDFEPQDYGICGESSSLDAVCLLSYGTLAHGMTGIGVAGAENPYSRYSGLKRFDYGVRLEGRMDRFTFAVTDFWGWDDNFVLDVAQQYGRRVDPLTGAPVNVTGPLDCHVRAVGGAAVGPNGVAGDADDTIPSEGNCLLFDNPESESAQQVLRASTEIAANHSVNQTLFHTICTLNFDPDQGYCPFDQINEISQFEGGAQLLSGIPLAVQSSVLEGIDSIRLAAQGPAAPSYSRIRNLQATAQQLFRRIDPSNPNSLPLSRSQGALLGCGASFVSPCGQQDIVDGFATGEPFVDVRGFTTSEIGGGPDFMNADASVAMQEISILKGLQPGAGVGTRPGPGGLRYEAGVSVAGRDAPDAATQLGLTANDLLAAPLFEDPNDPNARTTRADLIKDALGLDPNQPLPPSAATDGWIEPYPWRVDREQLQRGILVFEVADNSMRDPRCDPEAAGRPRDLTGFPVFSETEIAICSAQESAWLSDPNVVVMNDPTDPTNPANEFVIDFEGDELDLFSAPGVRTPEFQTWIRQVADVAEQCTPFIARVDPTPISGTSWSEGCTPLETVSANIERFLAAIEIMGLDRVFDPPETFEELQTVVDGDYSDDAFGDPASGPDGITTRNFRVFGDGEGGPPTEADVHGVQFEIGASRVRSPESFAPTFDFDGDGQGDGQPVLDLAALSMDEFFAGFNPESACGSTEQAPCYLGIARERVLVQGQAPLRIPVGSAIPVALRMAMARLNGEIVPEELRRPRINLLEVLEKDPVAFARLWAGEQVELQNFTLKYDRPSTGGQLVIENATVLMSIPQELLPEVRARDFDGDPANILELDSDQDGIYDGLDDGAPGPATDDNVLCGTGIPGDPLQSAKQYEFSSVEDEMSLDAAYPDGFPQRTPSLCRTLSDFLISSGQTLPTVLAGGDRRFGRRDFLWNGGQELTLTWEKRNVLGFAVDFAEDRTGTSWGLELSWTHDAHVANASEPSGVSSVDPFVLSVSVDRPTFFNFLNPNRSFFLNFQFFLQYLSNYSGGRPDEDGNFPYAEGPWGGLFTFTFFTGYFQDRLNPRATLVYEPTTGQGIVLWSLNYRWTANFSTALGVNHFFGPAEDGSRYAFPFTLFTNSFTKEEQLFRGFNAVRNRDQVELSTRYTW